MLFQMLRIGDKYLLPGCQPATHGFWKAGYECYNGHARIINAEATPLELSSDSLMESKITSVFIINDSTREF